MINVSTDHSPLQRHTKPIHSEWPHPSGGSLSPHRKSLIDKAHLVEMATPPRRKPFTSSKKSIQSKWPHPPGGSLSPHRKRPFSRNGHTPQAEASHLIEKAHSVGMATPPRRKPLTSSKKPIHSEWPHFHIFIYTTPRSALDYGQSIIY